MKTLHSLTLFIFCLTSAVSFADSTIAQGLRQALTQGATSATAALALPDAYYRSAFRIPFPPEAQMVESTLEKLGLHSVVDNVVVSLNRAAEKSAAQAKPILLDAIRGISLGDAVGILRGGSTSATDYLRGRTRGSLVVAYRPTVKSALDQVQATRYWAQAMGYYNQVPFVQRVNPDLTSYVTEHALDALFIKIGEEERRIRENPQARLSAILRDVFGSARR